MTEFLDLETETVQRVRTGSPIMVDPGDSVRDVLAQMKDEQQGGVLVVENGKLSGIFTERDALKVMATGSEFDSPIRSVMTTDPVTIRDTDTVAKAVQLMSSGGYRRLPVLDDAGAPVGMIKVSHILHYLVEHVPEIVYNLPPAPHHSTQEREGA